MTTAQAKPKKKSGISSKRARSIQCQLVERIANIYSSARIFHSTHEQMLESLNERVYNTKEWKKAPVRVSAYVNGYQAAKREEMWCSFAWLMWLDGKLCTSKEIDAITEQEKTELYSAFVQMCEESVKEYEKQGGSCRHPPTREEFNRNPSRFMSSDYKSPWARIDNNKSRHVWTDKEGNPLRDMPVDGKWRNE
jgi:hypothetical protein